jgi:alkyldihydroxyacetonephosphate synthase
LVAGTTTRRRKHWGWGFADQQPDRDSLEAAAAGIREQLGFGGDQVEEPVPLEAIDLPPPRVKAPASLDHLFAADDHERVAHALGKAYRDVVRGFRGQIDNPPDLVAHPGDEGDVERVLDWCAGERIAAIPYGGGTSVVGGVEPRLGDAYRGVVTIDLGGLGDVLDVDPVSRAARIQAGALGPALEDQLREHGYTLRHFPQSFEFSTLGGWIATRAGGHFATLYTHIDDLVESVRAVTPAGTWESRRLPGSGAGPSPDRLLLGSEGILGVITEAWVRVQERPRFKLSCGVAFDSFAAGAEAVRELAQSGLNPSNCRLLDEAESALTHAGPPGKALLVLGFESAHHPMDEPMRIALEAVRDHGGQPGEISGGQEKGTSGKDPVGAWRHAFLAAPYLRDTFVACGVLSDTFETAITWDRFGDFHDGVMDTARRAIAEACGTAPDGPGSPRLTCRFTHVYPDGPAPYYTVLCPARRGGEVEQWDEIKAAVSEAVIGAGGTITHHHAVGRDHRPWYDRQRPEPFAAAVRGAKCGVDPAGILNPGVLVDG